MAQLSEEPKRFERFAYFRNLDRSFENLARAARAEIWGPASDPLRFLKSYIIQTYIQASRKRKITLSADGQSLCFDTGLYTKAGRRLFAFFEKNKVPGHQEWFFQDWLEEFDVRQAIPRPPTRAFFFQAPRELLYDPTVHFRVDADLVLNTGDNLSRIQSVLGSQMPIADLRQRFAEAVKKARVVATTSYRSAVAQYFPPKDSIQFLLPLYFKGTLEDEADLALVVEKRPAERNPDPEDPNDWEYLSSSVLLLDVAYANARVLGPVESTWLTPRSALGLAEQRDQQTVDALSRLAAQHEAQQRSAAELSAKVDRVLHLLADDLDEAAPPPPQVALPRASVHTL
eukprot:m51a1_g10000 hypothetical protein (343) ;mRNA; f:75227-76581